MLKIRSLFVSDIHLGSEHCNHEKFLNLISDIECEYLYIVGDFIDGWALNRKFRWHKNYNTILQKILRLSRKGTIIKYCYGNHDDFMEEFNGINFGENISICREISHLTLKNENLLVLHGDQFDGIVTKMKWIQKIGAIIYDYSLYSNKFFRIFKFSVSSFLKKKAKEAVKYIASYETSVVNYCKLHNYSGIVTGHIHYPKIEKIEGINYYNTGDFVENNTAIIETLDGDLQLFRL